MQEDKLALLKRCTDILRNPPIKRKPEEIEMLYEFSQSITFFRNLLESASPEIIKRCVNVLQYRSIKESEILFKVGDIGTLFYIILRGSVGINIRLPNLEDPNQFDLKEVNQLRAGASFGELALLNDNAKRTATIIAKEDCDFAVMDKNSYVTILGRIEEQKIQTKISFLCQFPFFSSWSFREVKTISYHFEPVECKLNQQIITQNDIVNHFYVIANGQFEVSYNIQVERPLFGKVQNQVIAHAICLIGPGEFFAEESFLLENEREFAIKLNPVIIHGPHSKAQKWAKSEFNIVCRSENAVIYKITREDIQRRFWDSKTQVVFLKMLTLIHEFRYQKAKKLQKQFEIQQSEKLYQDGLKQFITPLKPYKIQQFNTLAKKTDIPELVDKKYEYYKNQEKKAINLFKKLYVDRNCSYAQVRTFFDQREEKNQSYFEKNLSYKLFFRFQNQKDEVSKKKKKITQHKVNQPTLSESKVIPRTSKRYTSPVLSGYKLELPGPDTCSTEALSPTISKTFRNTRQNLRHIRVLRPRLYMADDMESFRQFVRTQTPKSPNDDVKVTIRLRTTNTGRAKTHFI